MEPLYSWWMLPIDICGNLPYMNDIYAPIAQCLMYDDYMPDIVPLDDLPHAMIWDLWYGDAPMICPHIWYDGLGGNNLMPYEYMYYGIPPPFPLCPHIMDFMIVMHVCPHSICLNDWFPNGMIIWYDMMMIWYLLFMLPYDCIMPCPMRIELNIIMMIYICFPRPNTQTDTNVYASLPINMMDIPDMACMIIMPLLLGMYACKHIYNMECLYIIYKTLCMSAFLYSPNYAHIPCPRWYMIYMLPACPPIDSIIGMPYDEYWWYLWMP